MKFGVLSGALLSPDYERRAMLGEKIFERAGRQEAEGLVGRGAIDHLDDEAPSELGQRSKKAEHPMAGPTPVLLPTRCFAVSNVLPHEPFTIQGKRA